MTANRNFRVALAQLTPEIGQPGRNLERALGYVERAVEAKADLLMFPELYLHGYRGDELFASQAETIPGPTTERLVEIARRTGLHIVMGMARQDDGFPHNVYNSLCFVGPDGLIGHYDKMHLGTFHPFTEGVYCSPGRRAPVFDTRFGRVSLQICYDCSFPELTRLYALKGSVVNLVISAGPSSSRDSWRLTLQQRSKENLMPSVYCNMVGAQKDFSFFGGSKIVDARGRVTDEARFDEEDFITGMVDVESAHQLRRERLHYRDVRPELFEELAVVARSLKA